MKILLLNIVIQCLLLRRVYRWVASTSISKDYLTEIQKLNTTDISEPIKINNNIVIIKLNDKRILKQNNLNLAKIEKDIINKKKKN